MEKGFKAKEKIFTIHEIYMKGKQKAPARNAGACL